MSVETKYISRYTGAQIDEALGLLFAGESTRDAAYQAAEAERDTQFESKEATRDEANRAALDAAEVIAELQRQARGRVTDIDSLHNVADIGTYHYIGNGWKGLVNVNFDASSKVSQVALSSSTPSYENDSLTWLSGKPCVMVRTYTNGAWSAWSKAGADVVNDLVTGGTDKALSAEQGKVLDQKVAALGSKIGQVLTASATGADGSIRAKVDIELSANDKVHIKYIQSNTSAFTVVLRFHNTDNTTTDIASSVTGFNGEVTATKDADYIEAVRYSSQSVNGHTIQLKVLTGLQGDVATNSQKVNAAETDIVALKKQVNKLSIPITESGKYITTSAGIGEHIGGVTTSATYNYMRYPVSQGDMVIVSGVGGISPRLWAFVDSNEVILSAAASNTSASELELIAPANAAEVIINVQVASPYSAFYYASNSIAKDVVKLQGTDKEIKANISPSTQSATGANDYIRAKIDVLAKAGQKIYCKLTSSSDTFSCAIRAHYTDGTFLSFSSAAKDGFDGVLVAEQDVDYVEATRSVTAAVNGQTITLYASIGLQAEKDALESNTNANFKTIDNFVGKKANATTTTKSSSHTLELPFVAKTGETLVVDTDMSLITSSYNVNLYHDAENYTRLATAVRGKCHSLVTLAQDIISIKVLGMSPAASDATISISVSTAARGNTTSSQDAIDCLYKTVGWKLPTSYFEIGNVNFTDTGWGYTSIGTRVRLGATHSMQLKAGDVIGLTDYLLRTYYVGGKVKVDGEDTYISSGAWLTSDYKVTQDGEYSIVMRYKSNQTVNDVTELSDYFFISREGGLLSKLQGDIDAIKADTLDHVISIGHRGYVYSLTEPVCPENTLASYRLAKKMGYKYVETDVKITSDGEYVLLHDSDVDRTSNGTGYVANMTLAQLKALSFGYLNGTAISGYETEKIPTLEEFLTLCHQIGLIPLLEIEVLLTNAQATEIINLVKKCGMYGRCYILSMPSIGVLTTFHTLDPSFGLGVLQPASSGTSITQLVEFAASVKGDNEVFIDAHCTNQSYPYFNDEDIEACMAAGLPLYVYTINSEAQAKILPAYVTGLTTDRLNFGKILYNKGIGG